ncbi:MAG: TadE/TadG family protein [Sphingomonadaceae bacterium]|nr:TadE/TadG family protein [Sphingomonadaceae bacterium]
MSGTFLGRLLKDTRANTLAIGAASVIPLIGVVGGGVDASRMYLAKSRLQQACDSATLAARKQLGADALENGEIPASIQNTANNFFDANFADGMYGSSELEFELAAGSTTRIDGTASVEVPTTLMTVFGIEEATLNVECSAELNLPNIDVMLVLDVSGSMGGSRIAGLKNAVFAFYDEVMAVKPDEAQLRIGVVPYNAAVNVGGELVAADPDFIADSHTYQSREALFRQVSNEDGVDEGDELSSVDTVELLPRNPVQLGSTNQAQYHWNKNSNTHRNNCRDYAGTYNVNGVTWIISSPTWLANYWTGYGNRQKAACRANIRKVTYAGPGDVRPPTYRREFDRYEYKPITFDTSAFKEGETVGTPTGTQGATVNSTWNGCIEERGAIVPTSGTLPVAGAPDLDIDLVPDPGDPDTQWKPHWPQITYSRSGPAIELSTSNRSLRSSNCPMAAVRLQEWPTNGGSRNPQFQSYINSLSAGGNTAHDNGMLWGARFISPTGIFADDNESAANGEPISRHIIFMTDGLMEPGPSVYGTLGNFSIDGRFFGFGPFTNNTQLAAFQNPRLAAICEQAKNKNITVWTITFGLAQNQWTRACATGPQRAYEASSSAALVAAFRQIATSIAELRLVQ